MGNLKSKESENMNLKEKVKNLPMTPGIYLMKDQTGTVIYVGKAKSLKKRVQSYFQNSTAHPQKIKKMVANIDDFEIEHTDTEFEAFLHECRRIKELKPLFNRRMKSHLPYSYIAVKMDGPYRKISIVPEKANEGTLYFGPYTSPIYVKTAIEHLKESFKINCLHPLKGSPCLNYTLGRCNGLCLGGTAVSQYNEIADMFVSLLQGTDLEILEKIEQKMEQASSNYQFEEAAKYRNYIKSLSILLYKENVVQFTEGNKNIAVIEWLDDLTLKLFLIKGHKVIFDEIYRMAEQLAEEIKARILASFHKSEHYEPVMIGKAELDEAQIIYSYLNSSNAKFIVIPDKSLDGGCELENAIKELLIRKAEAP
jgi:excinuclease ABC subunit C